MARNFATSFITPYRGAIGSTPIKFCGARAVRLDFPWRQYGIDLGSQRATFVNPGVEFEVAQQPSVVLDSIQGVFIDNTACSSPVYLRADDTGHVLTCADGTSAFFPVFTGGTHFTLFIESVSGPYDAGENTRVILIDKPIMPYSDFQFAEFIPASQVSGQNAFAPVIQADQFNYEQLVLNTTDTVANRGSVDGAAVTLIPAETRFPNTLVITSIKCKVAYGRSTIERIANVRFYNASSAVGRELFKGATTLRLYNQPVLPVRTDLVDIDGVALRFDGTLPLRGIPRFNPVDVGNSGATPNGQADFVVDVIVCYARLRNPTT